MANANWARWVHASLAVYLKAVADGLNTPSLCEGIENRDEAFMHNPTRVEIRVNGPYSRELSQGYFELQVDANVLVSTTMGQQKGNGYELDTILGAFHEAMDGAIATYRFGTGAEDDDSLLGCLNPRKGNRDSIKVIHFGQIDATNRIRQGVVDARYVMHLHE